MKSIGLILILLLCLPGAAFSHELAIKTLTCLETEDILGGDECELRIFADGTLRERLRKDMSRGQSWEIRKVYAFKNTITVELWDLDTPDPDDHLGTLSVRFPQANVADGSARLSRDGARYELAYGVGVSQAVSPKLKAKTLLRDFSGDPKPGKFAKIGAPELIADLGKRIDDPSLIFHSSQALCGPIAVLYLLAKNDPETYVELARGLYRNGKYVMAGGGTIKPRESLFAEAAPPGVSPADWLPAASMRDAANLVFAFKADDRFAGVTLPGEMGAWLEGLLGCARSEAITTFVYGETDALRAAGDAVAAGNVAVLVADSGFMPGREAGTLRLADHWVVLLSVTAVGNVNKLKIWSWSKEYDLNLNEEEFKHFMWGAVIGFY